VKNKKSVKGKKRDLNTLKKEKIRLTEKRIVIKKQGEKGI